jgi:hypothetical protein
MIEIVLCLIISILSIIVGVLYGYIISIPRLTWDDFEDLVHMSITTGRMMGGD